MTVLAVLAVLAVLTVLTRLTVPAAVLQARQFRRK